MTYLDPHLRPSEYGTPAELTRALDAQQDAQLRAQADDVTAARHAVAALHAIPAIDFTPAVAAQIASVLSAKVTLASWSHFDGVEAALALLDDAHDVLGTL